MRNKHPFARLIPRVPRMTALEALADIHRTLDDEEVPPGWRTCESRTGSWFARCVIHGRDHLWITALAVQHGLSVLTQNHADFEGIPGVMILRMPPTPTQEHEGGAAPNPS